MIVRRTAAAVVLAGACTDRISCLDIGRTNRLNRNCGAGLGDTAIVDRFDVVLGCEVVVRR